MPDLASGPTSRPSSETERGLPRISILLSEPKEFPYEIVRTRNQRDPRVVRQPPIRGDRSPVYRTSGGRTARHHRPRLHDSAGGGSSILRSLVRTFRGAQEHHHLR